jgi:hypothetical protein
MDILLNVIGWSGIRSNKIKSERAKKETNKLLIYLLNNLRVFEDLHIWDETLKMIQECVP